MEQLCFIRPQDKISFEDRALLLKKILKNH